MSGQVLEVEAVEVRGIPGQNPGQRVRFDKLTHIIDDSATVGEDALVMGIVVVLE